MVFESIWIRSLLQLVACNVIRFRVSSIACIYSEHVSAHIEVIAICCGITRCCIGLPIGREISTLMAWSSASLRRPTTYVTGSLINLGTVTAAIPHTHISPVPPLVMTTIQFLTLKRPLTSKIGLLDMVLNVNTWPERWKNCKHLKRWAEIFRQYSYVCSVATHNIM